MKRLASWLLLIPYAVGYVAGVVALCLIVAWLALVDGYHAGRRNDLP